METSKIQSAMEYLMTYGWAILIIAVVLGALFGLGFFNSANLAPKVAAGSCQVYRPQGSGTTSFINLEGACNNELPQYVGKFSPSGGILEIANGPNGPSSLIVSSITVVAWVYTTCAECYANLNFMSGYQNTYGIVSQPYATYTNPYQDYALVINVGEGCFLPHFWIGHSDTTSDNVEPCDAISIMANKWVMLAGTYNSSVMRLYLNNNLLASAVSSGKAIAYSPNQPLGIGGTPNGEYPDFNGLISNVQIYNTSLTSNELTALYQEGVGGVPILPQNLVGWWPLNGNANDYSGNLNNGVSTGGVSFTSSWTSGYTAP